MDEDIYQRVIQFVSEETRYPANKITPSTTLGDDIGLDGDDADEFMTLFFETFGVDSENYRFDLYFGPEAGGNPFILLAWLLCRIFGKQWNNGLIPLTVGELVEAATTRTWPAFKSSSP